MDISTSPTLEILQQGKLTIKGEFMWGSNYTFLAQVQHEGRMISAVYKPVRGERPLWDFPAASLSHREVAAYLVSQALGWKLVPATAFRRAAPLGAGSLQEYIEHDPEYHYFTFSPEDLQRLRPVVLFDLLTNNADRKGGHIIKAEDGHLWLIDHGVCFHVEDKLRTVIWNFVGEAIPENLCEDLSRFRQALIPEGDQPSLLAKLLLQHLDQEEVVALDLRAEKLIEDGRFPAPDPYRRPYPWPQI
jgi:uncharacterized repeat protein (TIGR03843 family)